MSIESLLPDVGTRVDLLVSKIQGYHASNAKRNRYYEGRERVQSLGVSIPPEFALLETVIGWPGTVVDVLEERLDVDGFAVGDPSDEIQDLIADVWESNNMAIDAGQAHLDALITGVSFVAVSPGGKGEPEALLTLHSGDHMTGVWNQRTRSLDMAVALSGIVDDVASQITVWTDRDVIEIVSVDGRWRIKDRRAHLFTGVPVVPLVNRPRIRQPWGASEITRAVMSLTDTAVRSMLGMEIAREFYSAPQRYVLGADESQFEREDGSQIPAWESYLGRYFALTRDEDGDIPTVGQFAASSPAPYIDQLEGLAKMLSAEASIPPSYLGFHTQNPPGGDGIRASESRLVKRAERRQRVFGSAWSKVQDFALQLRGVSEPPPISTRWRDAATPTRAAAADATMKLVSAGILPAQSTVTWSLLGLNPSEQAQLEAEQRRASSRGLVQSLAAAAQGVNPDAAA